jgi:hypothetical protein
MLIHLCFTSHLTQQMSHEHLDEERKDCRNEITFNGLMLSALTQICTVFLGWQHLSECSATKQHPYFLNSNQTFAFSNTSEIMMHLFWLIYLDNMLFFLKTVTKPMVHLVVLDISELRKLAVVACCKFVSSENVTTVCMSLEIVKL